MFVASIACHTRKTKIGTAHVRDEKTTTQLGKNQIWKATTTASFWHVFVHSFG